MTDASSHRQRRGDNDTTRAVVGDITTAYLNTTTVSTRCERRESLPTRTDPPQFA